MRGLSLLDERLDAGFTLEDMDAERFGRALGTGVRETARALVRAADAAVAANPRSPVVVAPRPQAGNVLAGGKRFGEAMWRPAARAGGVLWHELTGVFFGLFALAAGLEVWKHRGELAAGNGRVWIAVAMFAAFAWFTFSSFRKARQRGKR